MVAISCLLGLSKYINATLCHHRLSHEAHPGIMCMMCALLSYVIVFFWSTLSIPLWVTSQALMQFHDCQRRNPAEHG